jgi:peptide/nickel transport system permease protein
MRVPARTWQFLRRWPVIPLFILGVMVVFAIFPNQVAPHDAYKGNLAKAHIPPVWYPEGSSEHVLGTDFVGRDLLSRVIHGARVSLKISAVALSTGIITGTALGLISGYFGGLIDEVSMRLIDLWASIPALLVGLIAAIVLGASDVTLMGVLALMAWSSGARNVRAEVLSLKARDYVALARVSGASTARIMISHILPGVVNTVVVIATLAVGGLIMAEAFLSYLGAGIPSPTPAWGLMTAEGKNYMNIAWWDSFFPGLAIFLTVVSMNFLGDWTRDHLDPRLRQL